MILDVMVLLFSGVTLNSILWVLNVAVSLLCTVVRLWVSSMMILFLPPVMVDSSLSRLRANDAALCMYMVWVYVGRSLVRVLVTTLVVL